MSKKSKIIIEYPKDIDLTEFKKDKSSNTKYGLPSEMKYCKSCVISNQRPNTTIEFKHNEKSKKTTINFNEDGVCDACTVTEKKRNSIDWEEKLSFLIGDTMTHNTGRVAATSAKYFKNTHDMIKNNVSEYLHYETGLLISREELDEFGCSIDRLRDDTARLQEKINRINQAT